MKTIKEMDICLNIENSTDYDVLNISEYTMDIINRYGNDDVVITKEIYNKSIKEIIQDINN